MRKLRPSRYFLVLGAGRGGTSLLAAMLDSHPKLEVGMERFAFDYLLGQKLTKEENAKPILKLEAFERACREESKKAKQQWGNKITTEQVAAIAENTNEDWPKYFDLFTSKVLKKKKLIFIVRDGRACVSSKIKRTDQDYQTALDRWRLSIMMMERFREQGANMLVCKYEDLVSQPIQTLAEVCRFLGFDFDRNMLEGHKNPKLPKMYQGQGLKKQKEEENWPEEWTNDMKLELEKLGYL